MTYRSAVTPGSRRSVLSAALVLAMLPLTACTTTTTCVDWVSYATAQDAYDDAQLVVVGTAGPVEGGATLFGVRVPVHGVEVEEVLKGTAPADLTVAQAPVTCSAEAGPDDALADAGRVVLLLVRDGDVYRTLTPTTGILPLAEGEPLPFSRD